MATAAASKKGASSSNWRDTALTLLISNWSWVFLIVLVGIFTLLNPVFLSTRNISSTLVSTTLILLMAIGQTYVIVTAGIDLSVGWTVGLSSVITATVMRDLTISGWPLGWSISLGIVSGLLVSLIPGIVNGLLVAKVRIPPFIATIGMFGIVRGAAFLLTDGKNVVGNLPPELRESLRKVGNGSLLYHVEEIGYTWFQQPPDLAREQLRSLQRLAPYPVLITLAIVIIFAFTLARTRFGRHTYAIGGDEEAARRVGISVDSHLIRIYMISAFTAGCAGVLHVFRFTAGAPNIGEANLLDSVAAVIIGGTSLFGGEGRISGTVIGALIIGVLQSGLVIQGVDALWQFIIVGVITILAVIVNQLQEWLQDRQVKQQTHQSEE